MAYLNQIKDELDEINEKLERMKELLKVLNEGFEELRISSARITPRAAESGTCPSCSGEGHFLVGNFDERCPECEGTGHV